LHASCSSIITIVSMLDTGKPKPTEYEDMWEFSFRINLDMKATDRLNQMY